MNYRQIRYTLFAMKTILATSPDLRWSTNINGFLVIYDKESAEFTVASRHWCVRFSTVESCLEMLVKFSEHREQPPQIENQRILKHAESILPFLRDDRLELLFQTPAGGEIFVRVQRTKEDTRFYYRVALTQDEIETSLEDILRRL